jgi:hypothetical protein
MIMKNFAKGISGALLSLAFIFGMSIASSNSAQGQNRRDNGNNQRVQRDVDRDGDIDRNDQILQTRRRRHRDDRYSNNRHSDRNRNNGRGNNDQYGNRGRGNGGYGNGGYDQNELNRGYQQGLNTGASDGQRGQQFNPQRSHFYKDASSQAFRQGFVQGYNQGFQQYSRNGNQRNRNGNVNGGWGGVLGGILGRP